ncbi:MAG: hypothetical protein ACHQWV_04680, partial [Nitrospirales bacterium]
MTLLGQKSRPSLLIADDHAIFLDALRLLLEKTFEVIGVVGDAKYDDLRTPAPPTGYLPITQNELKGKPSYTAVVRVDGPAG